MSMKQMLTPRQMEQRKQERETYQGATQRQFLYAAMTCHRDHEHGDSSQCVPDTINLGEN